MSQVLKNPFRGQGLVHVGRCPDEDAAGVARLLAFCPAHRPTPLVDMPGLANQIGVARLQLKDESARMGLGSFKALGAAHAIAAAAAEALDARALDDRALDDRAMGDGAWDQVLSGRTFIAASAGNHGLSVAAGARLFGAAAIIYLAETVPEAFAVRLRTKGAEVVRSGATYEDSMEAAVAAADAGAGTLLSDSSWPGYEELPMQVMEGYLQLAAEAVGQIDQPPTHLFLQAGVGGLAAAVAAHARAAWGDGPTIVVVEPEAAPALIDSIREGQVVTTRGPVSAMGRLDCKTPSMIALAGLARDADLFVTISEAEADRAVEVLKQHGVATTPSGAAGLAAALAGRSTLGADASILAIVSEGPEDG